MSTVSEMTHYTSIKYAKKIKRICEPLYNTFGLTCFFISHTTPEGKFYSISSNLTMHEYYFYSGKFKCSPFFKNPSLVKPGLYAYRDGRNTTFQHSLDNVIEKTNVELTLGVVVKKNNSLTRFGYGTSPKIGSCKILSLLTNNLPLLEKFNAYFVDEMKDALTRATENAIDLTIEIGDQYSISSEDESPIELAFDSRLAFLKQIGVLMDSDKISKRELEYLGYIAKGLTSAHIAKYMNLSTRTVENYIENLKHKLRCNSKNDLVKLAQLF